MRQKRPLIRGASWVLLFCLGLATQPLLAKPIKPVDQLAFGVEMAKRGLWNEAFFRFEQALKLDPTNPRILNNLAVAAEARGNFEGALKFYQEALRIAGSDAEIKRNYARFVEFYQSFKTPSATEGDGAAQPAAQQSPGGDG